MFVVGVLPQGKDNVEPADLVKTTKPNDTLLKYGMSANDFYQVRMKSALGKDENLKLRNLPEKKVMTGEKKFKTYNIFKNSDAFYFAMLAEEIENGNYVPLASEPNVVEVPIYMKGFFAKATTPFRYYLTKVAPDGKIEYLMSTNKQVTPDGRMKWDQVPATSNEIEIFVPWENDNCGNPEHVQRLLNKKIEQMRAFEVKGSAVVVTDDDVVEDEPVATTQPVAETVTATAAPATEPAKQVA